MGNSKAEEVGQELLDALVSVLSTLDACCEMAGFDKSRQHGRDKAIDVIAKAKALDITPGGE